MRQSVFTRANVDGWHASPPLSPVPSWPACNKQPNDVSWTVCDTTGFSGQAMTMSVANGACSVPEDVVQVSPLALEAPGTGDDDMCDLCAEYASEVSLGGRGGRGGGGQIRFCCQNCIFCSAGLWHG